MINNYRGVEDSIAFSDVVNKLRHFCLAKGFIEVHTQDRLSILAACEDPDTVATYEYMGKVWPLPQTGQMWLEYELLTRPDLPGVFCVSTSYRNEPNPVPGRHKLIFPMFEFEFPGGIEELQAFETELCEFLGFGTESDFAYKTYDELKEFYKTDELTHAHENKMETDFSLVTFCCDFPVYTSPFWNMRAKGDAHDIRIESWSPIGGSKGDLLDSSLLVAIGQKYGKSPAQVMLRWHMQQGLIAIPKSVHEERIKQNIDIFDFELSEEDLSQIALLDTGERQGPDPDHMNGV